MVLYAKMKGVVVMKIATKIATAMFSVLIMVLTIPFTIIMLIVDMINSVQNEKLTIDRTAELWHRWHHLFRMIDNGEI